jgi:drug/metabolite transporter (DMT)-like permease
MNDKKMGYLYLALTFCVWGSLYVVSKFVLDKIPPFTVSFLRYLISGIVLFFIMKKMNLKKIEREDYKYIFVIGFLGYFLSMGAQFVGTKLSNASLASLVNSMNPIVIMLLAAIILKEKLTLKKVICIIITIIGVYIIIGGVNGDGQTLGILVSVFSVITWSFVSVIVRKITQKYDALQITAYGIFVAIVCTLPVSIYEITTTSTVHFDYKVILSLIYMGIVCTALAHVLWNKSLSVIEASTCSLFYPVQPMVSVLLGWIFLGESIDINFIFGAILIVGGVLFSILGKRKIA